MGFPREACRPTVAALTSSSLKFLLVAELLGQLAQPVLLEPPARAVRLVRQEQAPLEQRGQPGLRDQLALLDQPVQPVQPVLAPLVPREQRELLGAPEQPVPLERQALERPERLVPPAALEELVRKDWMAWKAHEGPLAQPVLVQLGPLERLALLERQALPVQPELEALERRVRPAPLEQPDSRDWMA